MGNCWTRFEEWLCPNPWSGLVIDRLNYRYTVQRVSLDDVYNSIRTPPVTLPQSPALSASAAPQPQQQPQQQQPPPKTQPLPSPPLTPLTPPLKTIEELHVAEPVHEQKTPLLTAMAQPKHYNSVSSSPLILSGKSPAPAPPPLSLLNITMQKPLHIEY